MRHSIIDPRIMTFVLDYCSIVGMPLDDVSHLCTQGQGPIFSLHLLLPSIRLDIKTKWHRIITIHDGPISYLSFKQKRNIDVSH